ncbi:hypothetical protein NDU88_002764 [Pleurodeles waltl]|uniref:Uncharacterized protein n=1 Tax=Pleurodeles waltl TaxID=8319 RepID=A0AAV7Q6Z3_PLEWA|nr:hypothetical protein NDU88_002764 [Pleurodeles waltl]
MFSPPVASHLLLRRPTRHRQAPPPVVPVRTTPSGWARIQGQRRAQRTAQTRGRGRNSAATHAGPGPHQGARACRPGRSLSTAPGSPSHSGARSRGGGETAPPRSPRPRQSSRSTPVTGPPASARPGTDSKSAPPEPIS